MSRIRVVLADNHLLFRKGLARLLDAQHDFEVVGEAQDGAEAVQLVRRMRPDVVVMDNNLPVCDGPEATRQIKLRLPDVRVVILGAPADDDDLIRAVRMGADGYLLKDIVPEELFRHLRTVCTGATPLSPALVGALFRQVALLSSAAPAVPAESPLSPRELDVLRLVSGGSSNRDVAAQLAITDNTVKNHIRNILRKLGARNRAQASAIALARGIVSSQACKGSPQRNLRE